MWEISDKNAVPIKQEAKTAPVGALKIKDAAKYLGGVSQITVRRLIDRGLIRPNRALRHLLIPVSELDRFLTEGQR
jgi:excisionase family DNA binding protein